MPDPTHWLDDAARFLDALNCGAMLIDRGGIVVRTNARVAEMLGRPDLSPSGWSLLDLYSDADAREFILHRRANFQEPFEGEFYLPRTDGMQTPVILSSRVLGSQPPMLDLRLVTLTDITAQKAAENSLKEQYEIVTNLSNTILEQAVDLRDYSKILEQRVAERTAELHAANLDAIYMLAVASEAKDDDTGRHVRRIRQYVQMLATEMGLDASEVDEIGYSAVLHDVGKMHVPDHILKKPGPLTPEERRQIETHTVIGERILSDEPFFARARRIARSHHENWDGSALSRPSQMTAWEHEVMHHGLERVLVSAHPRRAGAQRVAQVPLQHAHHRLGLCALPEEFAFL